MGQRRPGVNVGTAAVVVLVVLAGCNGLVPADTEEATPSETLTPVPFEMPTPTETATPRPATFDRFLDDGRVDMDALLVSHTRTLGNESFVLVWNRRTTGGSGTIGEEFSRRIAVRNDSTYSRRESGTFTDGVVRTYIDPSGVYRRTEAANGSVETEAFPGGASGARTRFALLVGAVADLRFVPNGSRIGTAEREGTRYLQLFSTNAPEYLTTIYSEYDLREFQSTVWVHPDGYVRTVQYQFALVNGSERVDVAERYTYTDVGETTLERPGWAADLDPTNRSVTAANGTETPDGTPAATPDGTATSTPGPGGTGTSTPAGTATPDGTPTANGTDGGN